MEVEAGLLTHWGAQSFITSNAQILGRLVTLESGCRTSYLSGAQNDLQLTVL